jgi:hypothetical protein
MNRFKPLQDAWKMASLARAMLEREEAEPFLDSFFDRIEQERRERYPETERAG